MGFRTLRVLNDDRVAPGRGFGAHPHRDMEIFSYVLSGTIEHQDSLGNRRQLKPGEIQVMSAGTGVMHSEFNPSATEDLHLLQIWIMPRERRLPPRYTEWKPTPDQAAAPKVLVISPDGREGSASIAQDALVYRIQLAAGESVAHPLSPGRGLWLHLAKGEAEVNGLTLTSGDAVRTETPGEVVLTAQKPTQALLFDLV